MYKVFSPEWARAYHEAINASADYAVSGQQWREGQLALVLLRGDTSIAVIADLHEGVCRGVTSAAPHVVNEQAAYIIEGDESTWRQVLDGTLLPLLGIMRGTLRLTKGSIAKLLPYTKAANALVDCAKQVPTEF